MCQRILNKYIKWCYEYWNYHSSEIWKLSCIHILYMLELCAPFILNHILFPNWYFLAFANFRPLTVFTDLQHFSFLQDLQWFIFHVSNGVIITQASDSASCYMNKSSNSQIDTSMNCIKLNSLLFYASTCITEAFAVWVHKISTR